MKAWHWFLIGLVCVTSISYILGPPELSGEVAATYSIIGGIGLAIYYLIHPKPKDKIPINK